MLLHAIPTPVISDKKHDIAANFKIRSNNNVARNVLKDTAKRMDNVVVDINELHQRNALISFQLY